VRFSTRLTVWQASKTLRGFTGSGMCRVCDAHSVAEPLACVTLNALYGVKCHAREEIVSLRRLIGRVSYR
jgi:hypothetical protein